MTTPSKKLGKPMEERTFIPEKLAQQIYEIMMRHLRVNGDPWLEWSFCHALSKVGVEEYLFDSRLGQGSKIMIRQGNSPIILFSDDNTDIQKLAALVNARIAKAYNQFMGTA